MQEEDQKEKHGEIGLWVSQKWSLYLELSVCVCVKSGDQSRPGYVVGFVTFPLVSTLFNRRC